jgi:hypothetical protein
MPCGTFPTAETAGRRAGCGLREEGDALSGGGRVAARLQPDGGSMEILQRWARRSDDEGDEVQSILRGRQGRVLPRGFSVSKPLPGELMRRNLATAASGKDQERHLVAAHLRK